MEAQIVKAEIATGILQVGNKHYTVEASIPFVIEAEKASGVSLKYFTDWLRIPWEALPHVLFATLRKHHPEVSFEDAKAICDGLNPEGLTSVHEALCLVAFPEGMRRVAEEREKRLQGASPNGRSADVR